MYCEHWGSLEKLQLEYEHCKSIKKQVMNWKVLLLPNCEFLTFFSETHQIDRITFSASNGTSFNILERLFTELDKFKNFWYFYFL